MHFIAGNDRHQLQFHSLDDRISTNNPVRFMDAFVDTKSKKEAKIVICQHYFLGQTPKHCIEIL